ncbi:MAG: hypothetical protein WD469_12330 [Paenibacillaceae bacterium]
MKVKIGNKVYDSTQQPVLIIFDQGEQELIGSMSPEHMKFCSFPEDSNIEVIEQFMKYEPEDLNQLTMAIDNDVVIVNKFQAMD